MNCDIQQQSVNKKVIFKTEIVTARSACSSVTGLCDSEAGELTGWSAHPGLGL